MADTTTTIAALKPLVQRTPLTDKLLSKPPFRYLHDLVSELVAATGFGAGLFLGDETNAAAVKEKDQKISWLAKIIKLTELATGTSVKAKPAKIIAGLEPDETNAWLQVLAAACAKGIDTREMVASLGGSPPPPAVSADSLAPPGSELVGAPTAPPTPSQPADDPAPAAPAAPTPSAPASAKPAAAAEPKPSSKTAAAVSSSKSPPSKTASSSKDKEKEKDKDKDKKSSSSSSRSAPSAGASRSSSTSKKPAADTALGTASATKSSSSSSRKPSTSTSSSKDKEKSSSRDKLSSSRDKLSSSRDKLSSKSSSKSQSNSTDQLVTPAPPKPAAAAADPPAAVLAAPASAPEPIPSPAPPIATPDPTPVVLMAAAPTADASGNIDDDTPAADQGPGPADANAPGAGGSLGDLVARPIPGTARRERPTTARKAPPRPKQAAPEMGAEMGGGAATAGPGAGASGLAGARPGTASVVNVVAESAASAPSAAAGLGLGSTAAGAPMDDADDMFVLQRDEADLPVFGGLATTTAAAVPAASAEPVDPNAPHGGLVRKLLESKRAAAEETAAPGLARPASGMRRATSGDDSGASGGGKDLAEDLQARVQAVTRAAHPLGRTLDYLHEDMEAMNKELAQWRSESAKYRALLTREREVTEGKVRPLLDEMAKLDAAIVLEQERIAQAKARVLANEELVERYVLGMVTPGV